jgi:hypothetical protein
MPPMPAHEQYDPVYLHARREAMMVIALFALALTWSVGSYYLQGYTKPLPDQEQVALEDDPRFAAPDVSTILGMPTWVVTGILLPWIVIDVVAFWFCFYYMADDDLGISPDDENPPAASDDEDPPAASD